MRFLEGWPVPGNIVLGGFGQDVVSLMRTISRCEVSGIGRMTSSRKNGLGWSGPGCGQLRERIRYRDIGLLEGFPVSGNMVLDGLGQELVDLIKD